MSMTTTVYAIRHKPTGHYLPVPHGRGGRGGSHVEPIDFSKTTNQLPRLFPTVQGAKAALGQWLLGKFNCERSFGYDAHNGEYWDDECVTIVPVSTRIREHMEIVPITINLPSINE